MWFLYFISNPFYVFNHNFDQIFFLQFLLEDARSNDAVSKLPTKPHIPSSLDVNADTTVTLPLRRPSPKEIDDKGKLIVFLNFIKKYLKL